MASSVANVIDPAPETIEGGYDTDDSGYADIDSLTTSVSSSIYDFKYEHGRRFHAYKEGKYFMPNDESEQDRMDLQHAAVLLAFENKHFLAPIESPQRILDLGCGTGIWAMEVADQHPEAELIGVDLSPIQPQWTATNLKFEIDDIEDTWTWPPDHFDLVHDRLLLCGSIADFKKLFTQAYTHCKPGGYFEIQEMNTDIRSDDYVFSEDHVIKQWCSLMREGIRGLGRTLDLDFPALAALMTEVGFEDVELKYFKVPIGEWPANRRLKEAGGLQLLAMYDGLHSLSVKIICQCLGWTELELEVLLAKVRREFCNRRAHYYWLGADIYGRKPIKSTSRPAEEL